MIKIQAFFRVRAVNALLKSRLLIIDQLIQNSVFRKRSLNVDIYGYIWLPNLSSLNCIGIMEESIYKGNFVTFFIVNTPCRLKPEYLSEHTLVNAPCVSKWLLRGVWSHDCRLWGWGK